MTVQQYTSINVTIAVPIFFSMVNYKVLHGCGNEQSLKAHLITKYSLFLPSRKEPSNPLVMEFW